ncbi:rhodanese-like domain-containing protein [Chloroflexota bacterium]
MSFLKKFFGSREKEEKAVETASLPPSPAPEPEPIQINEILPQELEVRLDNGDNLIVVDMRQIWEYQAGHIPGARHIFLQEIPGRIDELPKDVDIVFQCWHGNTSLNACAFLIENGWPALRVSSLSGGIAGWVQAHGQGSLVKG